MTVHLSTIAFADHEYLERLVHTALGSKLVGKILIHDCSPYKRINSLCQTLADVHDRVHVVYYGFNRGCSACWNDSIIDATDNDMKPLIANDDVWFSEDDIKLIYQAAIANPEAHMISCAGYHMGYSQRVGSHGYSCFMLNKIAIQQIGMFDENIHPAYLEDSDYSYRAGLLGLHEANAPGTMVYHVGSAAIKSSPALALKNAQTHQQNFIYYRQKWGGINGEEVFEHPFNNPDIPLRISVQQRHTPYGEGKDRHGTTKAVPVSIL